MIRIPILKIIIVCLRATQLLMITYLHLKVSKLLFYTPHLHPFRIIALLLTFQHDCMWITTSGICYSNIHENFCFKISSHYNEERN